MTQSANIVGKVEYRNGDGPKGVVPRGPIDIQTTKADATLSWVDGETHGVAAMPLSDYKRYLSEGAIKLSA